LRGVISVSWEKRLPPRSRLYIGQSPSVVCEYAGGAAAASKKVNDIAVPTRRRLRDACIRRPVVKGPTIEPVKRYWVNALPATLACSAPASGATGRTSRMHTKPMNPPSAISAAIGQ